MPSQFKQVLLGSPKRNEQLAHERLSKKVGLSVLSSDAISSVAYATEEILIALSIAGAGALQLVTPLGLAIASLMLIVGMSYRQTIKAYPNGGGSYIVAKENLGNHAGLVAGASLLTDYILTVSVSISAGTAAITSAYPPLLPYTVPLAVVLTVLLAVINLRGVKESGMLLAWPTYAFIGLLLFTILSGFFRLASGGTIPVPAHPIIPEVQGLTIFLIMRAFASGCVAMTGTEAIANGVQVFKAPEARNARITLTWMIGILATFFLSLNALALLTGVHPSEAETVVSQLARGILGTGPVYYALQASTAILLVLAANTAYADFPRLSSFMAGDGFMPRQFKERGFRLVHSNGVILLTGVAIALIVVFAGKTNSLIPLYAVGVFTAFTLSQTGMVVHWWKSREPGWHYSIVMNGVGATATFIVLWIIIIGKFTTGAWVVVILIPTLIAYFLWVRRQYDITEEKLRLRDVDLQNMKYRAVSKMHNHVVLLVANVDRRLMRAIQYARSLKADSIEAIFIDVTGDKAAEMRSTWDHLEVGIRLTIIESPYREIIGPILDYIHNIPKPTKDHVVTVILPEFVPESVPDYMLHDQTSFWIKTTLFQEPGVILADVPYHLSVEERREAEEPAGRLTGREPEPGIPPAST